MNFKYIYYMNKNIETNLINILKQNHAKNNIYVIDEYKSKMLDWLPYINNQNINWILRLKDPNRKTIPAWEDPENTVATHKLGYSTSDTSDEIYPSVVQTRSGRLLDMSNPAFGFSNRDIYEYNKRRGEILNLPKGMGEIFTTTYKNYYPGRFKYNTPNKVESINLKKNIYYQIINKYLMNLLI